MPISHHPLDRSRNKKLDFLGLTHKPWTYYNMTKKEWAILDTRLRCNLRDSLRVEYSEKSAKRMKKIISRYGSDFGNKILEYAEYKPDIFWTVFPVHWNMEILKKDFDFSEDDIEKIKEIYPILRKNFDRKKYQFRVKSGLCALCGKKLVVGDKGVSCIRCNESRKISEKHRYNEVKEQGICVECRIEKNDGETVFCSTCREVHNLRSKLGGIKKRYFPNNPAVTFPILKKIYEKELKGYEWDIDYIESEIKALEKEKEWIMRDVYNKTIQIAEKEIITENTEKELPIPVVSQQIKQR